MKPLKDCAKGDVLVWPDWRKRKVLERLGRLVFIEFLNEEKLNDVLTISQLEQEGVTLEPTEEQWVPARGQVVWSVQGDGSLIDLYWDDNDRHCISLLAFNNVFKTREEAEARAEKIKNLK